MVMRVYVGVTIRGFYMCKHTRAFFPVHFRTILHTVKQVQPTFFVVISLECPKHAFGLRLGRRCLENINVVFTTKTLQLVYPAFDMAPLMRIRVPNCV